MGTHVVRVAVWMAGLVLVLTGPGKGEVEYVRLATWNIENYSGGLEVELRTVIYGLFEGRCVCPDIVVVQEFTSIAAVTSFLNILNSAPGSPADWAAAPFVDGPNTDSALFYRTSLWELVTDLSPAGVSVVCVGGPDPNQPPRNVMRYDVRLKGCDPPEEPLAIYSTHMKAGSDPGDADRRLIEAQCIRQNAENLPPEWYYLVAGDFNIPGASEPAYGELVGTPSNPGPFYDPINRRGEWHGNCSYKVLFTQDPQVSLDDRFDQILVSANLIDHTGFDYFGHQEIPWDLSTWNDPNHSYRTWCNDGTRCHLPLNTSGNTMCGDTIAQAVVVCSDHIPVFLDLVGCDVVRGACCCPLSCQCLDNQFETECVEMGCMFMGPDVSCTPDLCGFPNDMRFNEVVVFPDGPPSREFSEIIGQPNQSLCGLTVLVIEGEGLSKGQVDRAISLDDCGGNPCTLDANGYFVVGGIGLSPAPDLPYVADNVFENGTETFLLVRDCLVGTTPPNNDIDPNNDCIADVSVGTILDSLGIVDSGYPGECVYFSAPVFGPDQGGGVPPGAARCPNGVDTDSAGDWLRVSAYLDGQDGFTPPSPHAPTPATCGDGDSNGDGRYDLLDFAAFQQCIGAATAACPALELDGQCGITLGDYAIWAPLLNGPSPRGFIITAAEKEDIPRVVSTSLTPTLAEPRAGVGM